MRFLIYLFLIFTLEELSGVDFEAEIKPILEAKCLGCHNPNIKKGDLSLASRDQVLDPKAGLVVPGDAGSSELWQVATPASPGDSPEMPKEGEPLTEAESALLAKWIEEGANWPEGLVLREASKADKTWWAYQKLAEPKHRSIDRFIDEKLSAVGLERNLDAMAAPETRRHLIRRASYDLTGLPPKPENVENFVTSADPQAYEKLIDRLLESPHYGERWGRHWLDVLRFGESNGFERNFIINDLWPFRDYVIKSINEDKPFDLLIREHIAGDVFGKDDPDVSIGSCFLVAGPYDDVGNQDPKAKAQIRANTLDEIVNATGEAFLGMTVGCARCHDHKFDPILQSDYYQMMATFAGVRHGKTTLATTQQRQVRSKKIQPLKTEHDELVVRRTDLEKTVRKRCDEKLTEFATAWQRPKVDRTGTEEQFPAIEAKFVRLICDASDTRPESKSFRIDEFEVYSSGAHPENVALASAGAEARGTARKIEDFPGAYGAHLVIDGKYGARFISASNELLIELVDVTQINRVVFSSARVEKVPAHSKFTFVGEYRIEVSLDGDKWTEVANGADRKPVSKAHQNKRIFPLVVTKQESTEKARLTSEINRLAATMKKVPALPVVWMGTRNASDAKGPFHLFIGGSPQRKGEQVVPASLSTLSEVLPGYALAEDSVEAQRRLKLAEWITHRDNPLFARVLANRLWHYHFGTGIVDTPNDFGYMGGRPTHPELLDFLAVKLREEGWQLRAMHRLIMLSKTYRQTSTHREDAAQKDGSSRLLWRFPPRRLSAEEIRDTMLTVSGKLNRKMGGPGFKLYQHMSDNVSTYEPLDDHGPETYRRAVYHQNVRASVVDLMTEFDQADCAVSTPRRSRTTTPLQALTMLNHNFTIDMADALAVRVGDGSPGEQAVRIFRLAYSRQPDIKEQNKMAEVISSTGLTAVCRAVLNSSELIYLD